MGILTGKGSFTLPYSKYNVMYPELLGRVGSFVWFGLAWLDFLFESPFVLMSRFFPDFLQWALEMKRLSARPGYGEQWRGSVAVFIDSGSSTVSQKCGFVNLRCPV